MLDHCKKTVGMVRIILFFGCVCMVRALFGQTGEASKSSITEWNGKPVSSEQVKIFQTDKIVNGFDVDTVNQIAYLELREAKKGKIKETGGLVAYDLEKNEVRWAKRMDFRKERFLLHDTFPLLTTKTLTYALDRTTGEELWHSHVRIGFCAPGKAYCLGKYASSRTALAGLDLHSGKKIWEYMGGEPENFEAAILAGDSGLVLISDGLHYINFETGRGFYHEARTEVGYLHGMDYFVAGMLFGGLGMLIWSESYASKRNPLGHRVGSELQSVLIHNGLIYFSSLDEIMAVNFDGEVQWSRPLLYSGYIMSKLFVVDDQLYVINYGNDVAGLQSIDGYMFIETYESSTGELLARNLLNKAGNAYLTDFLIRDSTIVLAKNIGISELRLDNLEPVKENAFGDPRFSSGLDKIVNPPYYVMKGKTLDNRSVTEPGEFYIDNRAGMKICFTPEFEIQGIVRKPQFYTFYQTIGPLTVIKNSTNALVVNASNDVLNDIEFSNNMEFIGGRFFDYQNDKFLTAPLSILDHH